MVEIAVMSSFGNVRELFKVGFVTAAQAFALSNRPLHHMQNHNVDIPKGESVKCKDRVPESVCKAIAEALKDSETLSLSEDLTKVRSAACV